MLELPQWTGYFLWKQYINDQGGICVEGDLNMKNECTGRRYNSNFVTSVRMKVCMVVKIIDDSVSTDETYIETLYEWIDSISKKPVNVRPHFLIQPMGDNFNVIINKYVYEKYGNYGMYNYILGSWYRYIF